MNLNSLKKKIATYQSTKKVTKAMQNIASVKVTKLKHKTLLTKANLKHIVDLIALNKPIENNQYYHILFSPKKGLCGGMARRILSELEFRKNSIIIVAEMPLAKLISEKGQQVTACYIDLDDEQFPILDIYNQLQKLDNINILITYPAILNHVYSLNHIDFSYTNGPKDNISLYSNLEHAYYETRLCEETKRIEAMQAASDNCQSLLESTKLKYFKTRQAKITAEILEISNQ
jgi:F-type H+-transporting ATPase subunit gamma